MRQSLKIGDQRKRTVLTESYHQAHFPEGATIFETETLAEQAADKAIGNKRETQVDRVVIHGENFYVVKFWPKGSPHICTERRWAVFIKPHSKRKSHGTSQECGES